MSARTDLTGQGLHRQARCCMPAVPLEIPTEIAVEGGRGQRTTMHFFGTSDERITAVLAKVGSSSEEKKRGLADSWRRDDVEKES